MKARMLKMLSAIIGLSLLSSLLPSGVILVGAKYQELDLPDISSAGFSHQVMAVREDRLSVSDRNSESERAVGDLNRAKVSAFIDDSARGENVEFVGHIGGHTEAVALQGGYAYAAEGPSLTVLDISTPASPTIVAKMDPMPSVVRDVAVAGNYAYVVDGEGLRVVDVSTPSNPTEVGFYNTSGNNSGVAVAGDYVYIAAGPDGLRVVDVSAPSNPTEVGFQDTPGSASGIDVSGNYAYIADGLEGLQVVDVSTPSTPAQIGSNDRPGSFHSAHSVAVAGSYAYVVDGEGLQVVNISVPSNPTEVGFHATPGQSIDVAVAGDNVYVADGDAGLRVVDISAPSIPTEMGTCDTSGGAYGVVVGGTTAYVPVLAAGGFRVVDVSDPFKPAEIAAYETPGSVGSVAIAGSSAYATPFLELDAGLWILNISDVSEPQEVGACTTPGTALPGGVAVAGDYAYVADADEGLRVVDVSTASNPVEVGFCNTPGIARDVFLSDHYAYVADRDGGLRVIDVIDPNNPVEVGSLDTPGSALDVVVREGYAYVADGLQGVHIADISDPANPSEVGSYRTTEALSVAVAANYAYVADNGGGLVILDVSDPTAPTKSGVLKTPVEASGVDVSGDYAYVTDAEGGLRVADVSDPSDPTEAGFYCTPHGANDLAVVGDYAYVANAHAGLFILQHTVLPTVTSVSPHRGASGVVVGTKVVATFSEPLDSSTVNADSFTLEGSEVPGTVTYDSESETAIFAPDADLDYGHTYTATLSTDICDEAGNPLAKPYSWRFTTQLSPKDLSYTGPRYLPARSVMVDEDDGKITMGDHVHLQLPFQNDGTAPAAGEVVTIAVASGHHLVDLHNGTDWSSQITVPLSPTVIELGETGTADFWLYVDNIDPADRHALSGFAQIHLITSGGEWDVTILLEPISFEAKQNELLTSGSCLHHPDNFEIQKYAQYAAGFPFQDHTSATNKYDPDTVAQVVRNLTQQVPEDFDYNEGLFPLWTTRRADTTLLRKRDGIVGVCVHYADLATGLLRSLGIPARYVMGIGPVISRPIWPRHAWVEAYLPDDGWGGTNPTVGHPVFEEETWEDHLGWTIKQAWADRYPLSSASSRATKKYRCISPCYETPIDCDLCTSESNKHIRWVPNPNLSCVEDVTDRYHKGSSMDVEDLSVDRITMGADERVVVQTNAPFFVTRTVPCSVTARLGNDTTQSLDVLTATLSVCDNITCTIPLYDVVPVYHTVSDLASGNAVTVTWTVTPLVAGNGLPLRIATWSGDEFGIGERPVVVNEPDSLPPLTLGGLCGPGTVRPGNPFTLTAHVLDETLQPLTDTLTTVTATLYATPTLGYSHTMPLVLRDDGFFRQSVTLPLTTPLGTYRVYYVASRPGYRSDHGESSFYVSPPLTMTLDVVSGHIA